MNETHAARKPKMTKPRIRISGLHGVLKYERVFHIYLSLFAEWCGVLPSRRSLIQVSYNESASSQDIVMLQLEHTLSFLGSEILADLSHYMYHWPSLLFWYIIDIFSCTAVEVAWAWILWYFLHYFPPINCLFLVHKITSSIKDGKSLVINVTRNTCIGNICHCSFPFQQVM